jgi:5-methylcytosine-specific restriction protein A
VRAGRLVQSNQRTAKALAAGDISSAHVSIAARAARYAEDVYAEHEDVLVDAASAMPPDEFRTAASCWRSIADDVIGRAPDRGFGRRHLHLSDVLDGMGRVDGYLDAETLQRFAAVLDELERPDPVDGATPPRSLATRRADALARLVGGERAPRVTVFAVADLDTLHGRIPSDLADARCEVLGSCGGPLGLAALELLLCDCSISRVVMQGKSVVLDLGRSTPVVSDSQRRALAARDGGCTEAGCDVPPEWCDAHHEIPWSEGGRTDLDNLRLKCRRHHVDAHRDRARHRRGGPGCRSG